LSENRCARHGAAFLRVDPVGSGDGGCHLLDAVHNEAGPAMFNSLWKRAAAKRDDRACRSCRFARHE
jgi:hypothetical protein